MKLHEEYGMDLLANLDQVSHVAAVVAAVAHQQILEILQHFTKLKQNLPNPTPWIDVKIYF